MLIDVNGFLNYDNREANLAFSSDADDEGR
jgi:hypothetical protein